jgi:hypothetical protein
MILTQGQRSMRELNCRMAFPPLMNAALMISHNGATQKRLSNAIAEMQADPAMTHKDLCEVLADHILNEIRKGYEMS